MDVTERFYSTPEKAPCFWLALAQMYSQRVLEAEDATPTLSVCFHLSTTVLIDKTSFPDVITSRAHMLTSLRHPLLAASITECKTKIFKTLRLLNTTLNVTQDLISGLINVHPNKIITNDKNRAG